MTKDSKIEKTKFKLEALYKEYGTRTKEIELCSSRYHRNVGFVQTYLAALSSLATYIYFTQPTFFKCASEMGLHHFEIISALSFLTMFLFFLHATMMDTLYMLIANGSRVGVIEKKVNQTINSSAMEWENKVMPFILTDKWWVANGSFRPQPLVFISIFGLFIFAIWTLCFFAWTYANSYFGFYAVPTILIATFHLWQWVQLSLLNGGAFIKNSIFHIFGFEELKKWDTDIVRYLIGILTVILGFAVFAVAALQTNSFFPSDKYPFGLLAIPSIWIGDLFILPFLNRNIYDTVKAFFHSANFNKSKFILAGVLLAIVSFTVMGYLHYVWTKDAYTGFMDLELGYLSFAGWWHFVFSSVELTAILTALYIGITAYIKKDSSVFELFSKTWLLVLIFVSISVIDFVLRHVIIFIFNLAKSIYWINTELLYPMLYELAKHIYFDWISLTPFAISLLIYMLIKIKKT
jgi:hypothetical protein